MTIATDHDEFGQLWDVGLIDTDDSGLPVLLPRPHVEGCILVHSTPMFVAVRMYMCGCSYSATNGWRTCVDHHVVKGERV